MLAVAGATTLPAPFAPLVVLALLPNSPLDWMRRRGVWRCRSCWGCLHGSELWQNMAVYLFDGISDRLRAFLNALMVTQPTGAEKYGIEIPKM